MEKDSIVVLYALIHLITKEITLIIDNNINYKIVIILWINVSLLGVIICSTITVYNSGLIWERIVVLYVEAPCESFLNYVLIE